MKKLFTLLFYIAAAVSAKADYWTQKANFGGGARVFDCGFSTGNKGYIGCGSSFGAGLQNDFWEYDPFTNAWMQMSNFGGIARLGAVGFSIGNKGYIGTGGQVDFWEWDQVTNVWTQKANYGGGAVIAAFGFSIGAKGYIGTGDNNNTMQNDFWEWDQMTNTWSQKANFAGTPRWLSVGFSIGSKGYAGTGADGVNASNNLLNDFWEWDQSTNTWSQKSSLPFGRVEASGFSIGNYGFIGIGSIIWGSRDTNDLWEYNSINNTWTQVANFGAGQRELGVGFSIGCKGYFGTGLINDASYHDDFWEYTPGSYVCTTGIEETPPADLQFTISYTPASPYAVISWQAGENKKTVLTFEDVQGKKIYQYTLNSHEAHEEVKVPIGDLGAGIYFVELNNGKQKAVKKFLKE